jgi:glycerol kinase
MHELTALGLAEFCGVDVGAARSATASFSPQGDVSSEDHARFADAVERARRWKA